MQLKLFVFYHMHNKYFLCSFVVAAVFVELGDRQRENFRVLFVGLALFMCLFLIALNKCRKYIYKRNQYEYYMYLCMYVYVEH